MDGIQNVCTSMSRGGILPDYDYYSAILAAFAQSGNLDAINKVSNAFDVNRKHSVFKS